MDKFLNFFADCKMSFVPTAVNWIFTNTLPSSPLRQLAIKVTAIQFTRKNITEKESRELLAIPDLAIDILLVIRPYTTPMNDLLVHPSGKTCCFHLLKDGAPIRVPRYVHL